MNGVSKEHHRKSSAFRFGNLFRRVVVRGGKRVDVAGTDDASFAEPDSRHIATRIGKDAVHISRPTLPVRAGPGDS
ncbi:hypothetical protein [Herbidospora yilanensis]|uniref:hypothetical protein n=1 Tax=Herbidospora yilanensis TaxID=354426 RepID=UPI000B1F60C7|nr:hypothetical protein [Herbidospora yilanensis]